MLLYQPINQKLLSLKQQVHSLKIIILDKVFLTEDIFLAFWKRGRILIWRLNTKISLFEAQVLRFTEFFFIYVFISFSGIDLDAAIRILEHIEDYSTISEPPVKPKGGEMFIYLPANTQEQGNLNFHVRRYQRCSECKVIADEWPKSFITIIGNRQGPSNLNFLYREITFKIFFFFWENYKCDQYRWVNSGPKEIPRKNPLVRKQYFIGKLPEGKTQAFQKHTYMLIGDQRSPCPVLLHYIGGRLHFIYFLIYAW